MTSVASREQVRLLQLLDAVESAGLAPIEVRSLHTLAYFANVLSPVWDLPPLDGKVFKRLGGPFYPILQHDLDRLVGMGLVLIRAVGHRQDEDGRWRLDGMFELNHQIAYSALRVIRELPGEARIGAFLHELAIATSSLPDDSIVVASMSDPTFGDPITQPGNVVDFAEWQHQNNAATAAKAFGRYLPEGIDATAGELLHLYVHHLRSRLTS